MLLLNTVLNDFKEINPNRSESTYITMKYNLFRITKILNIKFSDLNPTLFLNPTYIIDLIDKKYSLNTRVATILGIIVLLKYFHKNNPTNFTSSLIFMYEKKLNISSVKVNKIIDEQQLTETEAKNWIDYNELLEKFLSYINKEFLQEDSAYTYNEIRNITLMALYVLLPPSRIGNYRLMKIRYEKIRKATQLKKEFNYFMITNDNKFNIVFNQYKTKKFIGQVEKTVENETLIKLLKLYIKRREMMTNSLNTNLFINQYSRQMTQTNITDTLKFVSNLVVKKELSVNMFRHIYLTDYTKKNNTIKNNKLTAEFMGQTYSPTMMEKYKKYEVEISKIKNEKEFVINFN